MKPVLQAILLAEHIYQDKLTDKVIIAGTFDGMTVREKKQPQSEGQGESKGQGNKAKSIADVQSAGTPFAYINLRNIHNHAKLILRYVYLDTGQVVFETSPITATIASPLLSVEIVTPLPLLPQRPGTYALEVHSENEMLGSHRVQVTQHE